MTQHDRDTLEYTLGFPNKEVYLSFWESLAHHFFRGNEGNPAFNLLIGADFSTATRTLDGRFIEKCPFS